MNIFYILIAIQKNTILNNILLVMGLTAKERKFYIN